MTTGKADERAALDLVGFTIISCTVDYAFSLRLARPEEATRGQLWADLRIEGPFECDFDGALVLFDAVKRREELGPALKLFKLVVEAAWADDDGTLHVQFIGGASLRVASSPAFEAWEVSHDDGRRVICMPSGKLAIWSAQQSEAEA